MKSVIFYGQVTRLFAPAPARRDIHRVKIRVKINDELAIDVRAEIVDGNCLEALYAASPEPNESILNTLNVPQ